MNIMPSESKSEKVVTVYTKFSDVTNETLKT